MTKPLLDPLDSEDEGTTILRNDGHYPPKEKGLIFLKTFIFNCC
jgi:hypothetical protein